MDGWTKIVKRLIVVNNFISFALSFSLKGRILGITIGCLIGMVPLLFMDVDKKKKAEEADSTTTTTTEEEKTAITNAVVN